MLSFVELSLATTYPILNSIATTPAFMILNMPRSYSYFTVINTTVSSTTEIAPTSWRFFCHRNEIGPMGG